MMPFQKAFLNSPEIGRHLELPNCVIHYHEQGEGPPLVLLHGLGFSLYTYRRVIPELSVHSRVVSVDLPGCGYSAGVPGRGSIEDMTDALHGFIASVSRDEPVNLLGTAEGAVYAMRMAQRYPETVSAMILESPGSLTRYYPWKWQQLLTPVLGDWLIRRISDGEMEQALRWLYFDETTIRECEVHQFIQPFRNPQTGRNLLGLLRSFDNREVYRRMNEIRCPVYFIWGENDPCHPVAMSSIFTGSVDGCRFRMFRNCGHLVHEERPVEFCETVSGFLPSGLPGKWRI